MSTQRLAIPHDELVEIASPYVEPRIAFQALEPRKVITWRPLADDGTQVHLVIQRARSASPPRAARDLHEIFVARARDYTAGRPPGEFLPGELRSPNGSAGSRTRA